MVIIPTFYYSYCYVNHKQHDTDIRLTVWEIYSAT